MSGTSLDQGTYELTWNSNKVYINKKNEINKRGGQIWDFNKQEYGKKGNNTPKFSLFYK